MAHIIYTPDLGNRDKSLLELRLRMMKDNSFEAAFFIGGMEGVEEEFKLFTTYHPNANVFPIASTGAAAKLIYDKTPEKYDTRLLTELTYSSLFKELLNIK